MKGISKTSKRSKKYSLRKCAICDTKVYKLNCGICESCVEGIRLGMRKLGLVKEDDAVFLDTEKKLLLDKGLNEVCKFRYGTKTGKRLILTGSYTIVSVKPGV